MFLDTKINMNGSLFFYNQIYGALVVKGEGYLLLLLLYIHNIIFILWFCFFYKDPVDLFLKEGEKSGKQFITSLLLYLRNFEIFKTFQT